VLCASGRFVEAEPLFRRALSIDMKAYAPDHPMLAIGLGDLALLLRDTGRLTDAIPMMERAVAIFRAALGDDHPSTEGFD
jgi:hypothetical protein